MGQPQHLLDFAGDQENRGSIRGKFRDRLMDAFPGADIDAAAGFIENHDLGIFHQPFSDQDLLLIAARVS